MVGNNFTEQDIIGFTIILGFCTLLLILKASSAFRARFDSNNFNQSGQTETETSVHSTRNANNNTGNNNRPNHSDRNVPLSTTSAASGQPEEKAQQSTKKAALSSSSSLQEPVVDPSKTVLVVDDDPVTRHQLRRHLEQLAFHVREVSDGTSAVRLYEEGVRFCMVVMDYEMPDMNGFTAIKKIRFFDNDVVIIGSTIHDPATMQEDFLKAGANFVDIKPISLAKLEEFISEYNLNSK
jgi:CheY-like chemotaxis protein